MPRDEFGDCFERITREWLARACDGLPLADDVRRIGLLRMEGVSVESIADRVQCAPRTVRRRLHMIRTIWEREAGDAAG